MIAIAISLFPTATDWAIRLPSCPTNFNPSSIHGGTTSSQPLWSSLVSFAFLKHFLILFFTFASIHKISTPPIPSSCHRKKVLVEWRAFATCFVSLLWLTMATLTIQPGIMAKIVYKENSYKSVHEYPSLTKNLFKKDTCPAKKTWLDNKYLKLSSPFWILLMRFGGNGV